MKLCTTGSVVRDIQYRTLYMYVMYVYTYYTHKSTSLVQVNQEYGASLLLR